VTVVGGSGYIGGELIRLLLGHPRVEFAAVTSEHHVGRRVDAIHPNLRGLIELKFTDADDFRDPDVLLLAGAHRKTMIRMPDLLDAAKLVIDLSGDFRLRDPAIYARYYEVEHAAQELIGSFVTGLPELYRDELREANRISVPGCMATAGILALTPLAVMLRGPVYVDARCGSSGAGVAAGLNSLHAERSGALRVFAPTGHRHEAEIGQATGLAVRMTATGIDAVRGVQVVCRATVADGIDEVGLWAAYRRAYSSEPFIRIVAQRRGIYRYPEPKILLGSNYCDVGFALEHGASQVTAIAALDNLVKGGAGNAVQCLNIRFGWPERLGLEFPGLHPN
jgi:N-acetyl-gamma-glutamyl-phosphate/LysW-gamma-L-alpha-aminoadipyl-6-phosphate reductase